MIKKPPGLAGIINNHLSSGAPDIGFDDNITFFNVATMKYMKQYLTESSKQVGDDTWSTYVRPSGSRLSFYVRRTLIWYTEKI